MAHRRGESPAANGPGSRLQKHIAVVGSADSRCDDPLVTVQFHGGAKPPAHPPDRRTPRERDQYQTGVQQRQMVPRPCVLQFVANDCRPGARPQPQYPRGDDDPWLGDADQGGAEAARHMNIRVVNSSEWPAAAGTCDQEQDGAENRHRRQRSRAPHDGRRSLRFPARRQSQGRDEAPAVCDGRTVRVVLHHCGSCRVHGRPGLPKATRERNHDRQRQRRHPRNATRLARGRQQPFQRQAPRRHEPPDHGRVHHPGNHLSSLPRSARSSIERIRWISSSVKSLSSTSVARRSSVEPWKILFTIRVSARSPAWADSTRGK